MPPITAIGEECFVDCDALCDQLSYVYVPDSVTEIGHYAFDDCPWLIISFNSSQASNLTSDYDVDPLEIITRAG